MLKEAWNTIVFNPLSWLLESIVAYIPGHDLGIAVILLTFLVKIALFPLTKKTIISQVKLKKIQPEIDALKKEFPNDQQKQSQEMMALYKKHNINPFSGCLPIILQLPILLGLYYVVETFIGSSHEYISTVFLGFIDIKSPNIILAFLAGFTQFIQMYFSPTMNQTNPSQEKSMQADFMAFQVKTMKYILPIFIFVITLRFPGVVALYWITSNVFTIIQEYFLKRTILVK